MMHLEGTFVLEFMHTDTFEKAIGHLEQGQLDDVRRLARPLLLNHDARAEGLYLLARAYLVEGKPHIALYLLEEAAERVSPPETGQYLDEARGAVEASGWTEDFTDRGHTVCNACRLYYRGEYPACPYCSEEAGSGEIETDYSEFIGNEELGWEDDVLDKADRIGRSVVERAKEIADSRSVKELGERARAAGKEAVERARTFSEKEEVRQALERAKQLGNEASESAKKLLEADTARSVQETARETGTSFTQHVREFVDEERKRYETADADRRRAILIKWIGIGIAALIALRVLAWIL